jgi:hypothetical protein
MTDSVKTPLTQGDVVEKERDFHFALCDWMNELSDAQKMVLFVSLLCERNLFIW